MNASVTVADWSRLNEKVVPTGVAVLWALTWASALLSRHGFRDSFAPLITGVGSGEVPGPGPGLGVGVGVGAGGVKLIWISGAVLSDASSSAPPAGTSEEPPPPPPPLRL